MTDASSVSLGGETVKATAAKFTMAIVGFVGTIVFARILGPTAFGGFYLLFALVKLGDRAVVGWGVAVKKRYSETGAPKGELLGSQLAFTVGWVCLSLVAVVVAAPWLTAYTGLSSAPVLFVVLMAAVALYEPLDSVVQARGLVGASMWTDTLRSLLTFPLQLGLVLLGLGAAGMAYGLAAATVLSVPVLWYFVSTAPVVPSRETLADLWSYARYSSLNSLLGTAYDRFDVLVLGWLLAPAAAGNYEVAFKLTLPATFVMLAASSGLMARVSHRHSKGEEVSEDVSNTLAFASIVAFPMSFGALALADQLVVTVYGPAYADAATLLVGLELYQLVRTQSGTLSQVVDGIDRPEVNTRVAALTLGVNIVLGIALTLSYGAIGVVVATVVAETLRYVALARVVTHRLPDVTLLPRTLAEQLAASVVMFAVVVPASSALVIDQWSLLLVVVALGAAVYGVTLAAISRKLRVTIEGVVRGSRLEL